MKYILTILLLINTVSPAVADERIGNWTLQVTNGTATASTTNQKSGLFVVCNAQDCTLLFAMPRNCVKGEDAFALIVGGNKSTGTLLECVGDTVENWRIYKFSEVSTVFNLISEGGVVAIAFGVKGGAIAVERFNVSGIEEVMRKIDTVLPKELPDSQEL